MPQSSQPPTLTIQRDELAPIVAQAINLSDALDIDRLDWQVHPVGGVGGSQVSGGLGVFRLTGSAEAAGQVHPWSAMVKISSGLADDPLGGNKIPASWNYWKREVLAYRSGMLAQLSDNLVAPRCYGVNEHPNEEWRVWLEDVQPSPKTWTLARHGLAARHLGQFNGSYLSGRALPAAQPWLYHGRTREWFATLASLAGGFDIYAQSDAGRRWITARSAAGVHRILANQQQLLQTLDRLPLCLCHHDAFRRNLLARDSDLTGPQTVALDWAMFGYGGVGEEAGVTTAVDLTFMEIAGDRASELDQTIFDAYVNGLRDAGWHGDVRLARFGYAAAASIVGGAAWAIFMSSALATVEGSGAFEVILGHTHDEILEQLAQALPFLLGLGDEAIQLMHEIK